MSVAVVTDSTAGLTPEEAEKAGVTVVPLQLVIAGASYDDGVDPEATPEHLAEALREFRPVSTSRPSPQVVLETYEDLAETGVEAIVSVHLSSQLSATYESAQLATRRCSIPVVPVDTRQIGAATGYAALAAARAAALGAPVEEVAEVARRQAERITSLFYVDTLEYLRRGGRVGAVGALVGSALAVKPILQVEDGRIVTLEKVRTSVRAIARLEELAMKAAHGEAVDAVDVTVCHLANPEGAERLAAGLSARLGSLLHGEDVAVQEVGAVLGAHVGPGLLGVVVAPRL
ncbi:DegV family protein [Nocardioides marmoribigeumensis]|uniref:DegV family protein with EDD domain n=1 Tax=Nocardioides marmoribigeumensis TaxID=433649 RepID=A0ABU2C0T9_9ACTN|nr:DegV family protein [Nocardioides marmoribigeumensis]MDR7364257.1 DegV family protein with EDD domain [Nocardioides marmoribigeumensis]